MVKVRTSLLSQNPIFNFRPTIWKKSSKKFVAWLLSIINTYPIVFDPFFIDHFQKCSSSYCDFYFVDMYQKYSKDKMILLLLLCTYTAVSNLTGGLDHGHGGMFIKQMSKCLVVHNIWKCYCLWIWNSYNEK